MAAPTTDRPTGTGSAAAGSRPSDQDERRAHWKVILVVIVLVAVIGGLFAAKAVWTARYKDGFQAGLDTGACNQKFLDTGSEFKAYSAYAGLSLEGLSFVNHGCNAPVTASWSMSTTEGGRKVTQTCTNVPLQKPDKAHPLPWVKDARCVSRYDSTASVGQPVKPGG